MVTAQEIVQTAIDTLVDLLPERHKRSVIQFPDRPDQAYDTTLERNYPHGAYVVRFMKSAADERGNETIIIGVVLATRSQSRSSSMATTVKMAMQDVPAPTGHKLTFAGIEQIEFLAGWIMDTVLFSVPRPKQTVTDKQAAIAALNP